MRKSERQFIIRHIDRIMAKLDSGYIVKGNEERAKKIKAQAAPLLKSCVVAEKNLVDARRTAELGLKKGDSNFATPYLENALDAAKKLQDNIKKLISINRQK